MSKHLTLFCAWYVNAFSVRVLNLLLLSSGKKKKNGACVQITEFDNWERVVVKSSASNWETGIYHWHLCLVLN